MVRKCIKYEKCVFNTHKIIDKCVLNAYNAIRNEERGIHI